MAIFELEFKIRHNCRLAEFSIRNPLTGIHKWRIKNHEIIEVFSRDGTENPDAFRDACKLDGVIDHVGDEYQNYLVSKSIPCGVDNIIEDCSSKLDILHIAPVSYYGGWEYHRVLAFRQEDITKMIREFQECSYMPWILRKVPFSGFSAGSMTLRTEILFEGLTDLQTDAVLTAHSHGYYRIPRSADVKTIAGSIGVRRTTFQEHLRKAENKIMRALVPHLHTWHHFSGKRGAHPAPLEETITGET
ncbi:MAG: helix-turn-helix domain-containing protein [Candidatus Thorarchaeota archaeon]